MTELVMAAVSTLKYFYKVPQKQTVKNRKKPKSSHRSKWKWGVSALVILSAYIWAFWAFFVSPTAFRWQALYGDKKYPNGYEIQGIDIRCALLFHHPLPEDNYSSCGLSCQKDPGVPGLHFHPKAEEPHSAWLPTYLIH